MLYRWPAASHRHVLEMVTVVSTPTSVRTVRYRHLIANTLHIVQPDRSGPRRVEISKYSAIVSKIHKRKICNYAKHAFSNSSTFSMAVGIYVTQCDVWLSIPAWSFIFHPCISVPHFQSCVFHPCSLMPHFPSLHFQSPLPL